MKATKPKSEDLIYALIAFGGVVVLGSMWMKSRARNAAGVSPFVPASSPTPAGAGGSSYGGSYFPAETQMQWGIGPSADADMQNGEDFYGRSVLPAWANL